MHFFRDPPAPGIAGLFVFFFLDARLDNNPLVQNAVQDALGPSSSSGLLSSSASATSPTHAGDKGTSKGQGAGTYNVDDTAAVRIH